MTLTKLDFYIAVFTFCLTLLGGVYIHEYTDSHKADQAVLQQVKQQTKAAEQQDTSNILKAQQAEAQNQKDTAQKITSLHEQQTVPVSPVDYAKIDAMIQAHIQAPTAPVTQTVDDKPLTTIDTKALRDYTLSCDIATTSLDSCKATVTNKEAMVNALTDSNKNLQAEVLAQDKVIKGGGFWKRVGHGLKHSLCGATGVAVGYGVGNTSNQAKGGVITGSAAWAGCEALLAR